MGRPGHHIKSRLEFLGWSLGYLVSPQSYQREANYWPLLYSSFWLDYRLWGLNPFYYHLENILLHVIKSLLVYVILRRLGLKASGMAAILFTVHPVQVESVVWAIERKGLLSSFFHLLAALFYVRYVTGGGRVSYCLSLMSYPCALLTKTTSITLPAALTLAVIWHEKR